METIKDLGSFAATISPLFLRPSFSLPHLHRESLAALAIVNRGTYHRCCKRDIDDAAKMGSTINLSLSSARSSDEAPLLQTVCGASCCKRNLDATIVQQGHTRYCKKADTAAPSRCRRCYKRPTPLLQKGRRRCSELSLTLLQKANVDDANG